MYFKYIKLKNMKLICPTSNKGNSLLKLLLFADSIIDLIKKIYTNHKLKTTNISARQLNIISIEYFYINNNQLQNIIKHKIPFTRA